MTVKSTLLLFLTCSLLYGSETDSLTTRIIYYIHGDASYLFHNREGAQINADTRILKQALCVAQSSFNSEVFILHHKPARKFLFFFRLENLDFYYFRNGELKEKSSYGVNDIPAVQLQFDLIKKYGNRNTSDLRNFYLFYGHQIPEGDGYGYNSSQPDLPLNIILLKEALKSYIADKQFEMILLSTCKNGTRYSVGELAELSKYIIASPEDLSLYHISSIPFKIFSKYPHITTNDFTRILSRYAFKKLKSQALTVTAISLYDTASLQEKGGVSVLFNPPHFGKNKNDKQHSGWSKEEKE